MNKNYAQRSMFSQASFTFTGLCFLQLSTWLPLRFWEIWGGGNFIDTWQILRYGKCYETVGLSVYENSGTNCSNYLYGRTLLQVLSFLGVDVSLTQAFGYTFIFLLAIGLSWIFPIQNKKEFLIFVLVVLSPPVMLLAERGNFDTLIFFLLILVAKFVARANFLAAYILLTVTVLLKYYTAPVFLVLIIFSKQIREKILGVILLVACVLYALRDIAITKAPYPQGSGAQFGFSVWGEYLNKYSSTQIGQVQKYLVASIVFGLVLFSVSILRRKFTGESVKLLPSSCWESIAFWIFLVVSISCYFGGMNFDYRLIYFAVTYLLAYRIIDNQYKTTLTLFLMMILWLSFPSGGLQPLGDLTIEITAAFWCLLITAQILGMFGSYKLRTKPSSFHSNT